jgi:hypothetical protein
VTWLFFTRLTLLCTGFVLQTTNDILSGSGTSRGSWEQTAIFNSDIDIGARNRPRNITRIAPSLTMDRHLVAVAASLFVQSSVTESTHARRILITHIKA